MKDYWNWGLPWLDLKFEIAISICRSSKLTCDVTVVPNLISLSFFTSNCLGCFFNGCLDTTIFSRLLLIFSSFSLRLTILLSRRSISSVFILNLPLQIQQVSASANFFLSSSVSIRSALIAKTSLMWTSS